MMLFKRNNAENKTDTVNATPKKHNKFRLFSMLMTVMSVLCVGAFADDGTGGTTSGGFSAVWGSFDDLSTLMTKVWSMMTSNPLLTIMLAVLLLAVGCRVVRMLMHTARGH
jgi:hypothetical protein